jgi:hypothetical protein
MIVVALLVTLAGCCTCRERYSPALTQWAENLDRLRPTMEAGAGLLPEPDLTKTKMDLYDRTLQGIKRVNGEGPQVWTATAADAETERNQ